MTIFPALLARRHKRKESSHSSTHASAAAPHRQATHEHIVSPRSQHSELFAGPSPRIGYGTESPASVARASPCFSTSYSVDEDGYDVAHASGTPTSSPDIAEKLLPASPAAPLAHHWTLSHAAPFIGTAEMTNALGLTAPSQPVLPRLDVVGPQGRISPGPRKLSGASTSTFATSLSASHGQSHFASRPYIERGGLAGTADDYLPAARFLPLDPFDIQPVDMTPGPASVAQARSFPTRPASPRSGGRRILDVFSGERRRQRRDSHSESVLSLPSHGGSSVTPPSSSSLHHHHHHHHRPASPRAAERIVRTPTRFCTSFHHPLEVEQRTRPARVGTHPSEPRRGPNHTHEGGSSSYFSAIPVDGVDEDADDEDGCGGDHDGDGGLTPAQKLALGQMLPNGSSERLALEAQAIRACAARGRVRRAGAGVAAAGVATTTTTTTTTTKMTTTKAVAAVGVCGGASAPALPVQPAQLDGPMPMPMPMSPHPSSPLSVASPRVPNTHMLLHRNAASGRATAKAPRATSRVICVAGLEFDLSDDEAQGSSGSEYGDEEERLREDCEHGVGARGAVSNAEGPGSRARPPALMVMDRGRPPKLKQASQANEQDHLGEWGAAVLSDGFGIAL